MQMMQKGPGTGRLYGLPAPAANRLCVGRAGAAPRRFPLIPAFGAAAAMDSFEINKILGAFCYLPVPAVASISPPARFSRRQSRQSPATRSRSPSIRTGGAAGRRASRRADRGARWSPARRRAGRESGQEMRRLPHLRQGRPNRGRPEPLGRGRPAEGHRRRVQLFGRALKAKGGNWTVEDLNTFLANPKGFVPGHQDDLRRHAARQRAGRRHRLPEHQVGQSRCRCRRRPKRRRRADSGRSKRLWPRATARGTVHRRAPAAIVHANVTERIRAVSIGRGG